MSVFATVVVLVAATVAAYALTRSDTQGVPAGTPLTSVPPATGSKVDLSTGAITPLPASIATAGNYYAVSPDHARVAYSTCCKTMGPLFVANVDGTHVRQISSQIVLSPIGWNAFGGQWSPDGSLLVYQQRNGSTLHLGNLFVQDIGRGHHTMQITNFDQRQRWDWWFAFPSFAPDGRSILFQLPSGDPANPIWNLWSVPLAGGKQTLVRGNAGWGAYSPDGNWLAYLSPVSASDFTGGQLWIVSVHGGTPRALGPQGHLSWLRWSPDGTRISYSAGGSIYVLDVATGSATWVAEGGNAEWFDDHTLIVGNRPD